MDSVTTLYEILRVGGAGPRVVPGEFLIMFIRLNIFVLLILIHLNN